MGFAAALDVDLTLEVADSEACMISDCGGEAVMAGIISTPCGCPQPLCLPHYERERPKWQPGDGIHCYLCPMRVDNGGYFVRWEKLK